MIYYQPPKAKTNSHLMKMKPPSMSNNTFSGTVKHVHKHCLPYIMHKYFNQAKKDLMPLTKKVIR